MASVDSFRWRNFVTIFSIIVLIGGILYGSVNARPFVYTKIPTDVARETTRWQERIDSVGAAVAYDEFGQVIRHLVPSGKHIASHIFGAALYEEEGVQGLSVCDTRFLYGCFHELLSRAIIENGISIVGDLEKACLASSGADAPLSCKHGLGHGLVAYFGYTEPNLYEALSICDTLRKDPIGACYEGVYMEYFLRFFSSADGADAREFNPDTPYDACAESKGLEAQRCIGLLALWWRTSVFNNTVSQDAYTWMGKQCDVLPAHVVEYRYTCFRGIGFAAAVDASSLLDIERACNVAGLSNVEDVSECIFYATLTVGNAIGIDGAVKLCETLPETKRSQCKEYAQTHKLI